MSVTLSVVFRDPPSSLSEIHTDIATAGAAVAAIADRMGAEVSPGLGIEARRGHLLRDRPTDAPIRISEVVATFDIEDNP